jgi:asparagine synthase (glutamine-hydrolysing)
MCGIVGIHSLDGQRPIPMDVLAAMNRALTHRGPDSEGYHEDPGSVGLAMRRLSIIDVAGGDQPISNEDGTIWTVFNGEIYNFRELRSDLESRGHRFRTHSDTEAIVHAYEEYGDDCVKQLRGMFGFAVWDAPRRRLLLARDRVGIKQLYYTVADGQLLWGSEIKGVLQHPSVSRRLNPSAVNHFLTYLYVTEPLTAFEDIHELPAGHVLVSENGSLRLRQYWCLRYDVDEDMGPEEAAEGLRERLDDAVRQRLVSDVPLGAFLSGGIDSGAIVALMAQHSNAAVETFSIGYDVAGEQFDERTYAREVAERYSTNHHEFVMEPDLTEVTDRLVRAFDQPSADASAIPTWYISKYTREHVTVALSGVGGDELAAGYERHRGSVVGERFGWLPGWLVRRASHPLTAALPDSRSGGQWMQRAKRFVRTLDQPFDDRYFELGLHLGGATRAAHPRDVGADRPRRAPRPVPELLGAGRGGGSAEPRAVRGPEAVPAQQSPAPHGPHVHGPLTGGAGSLPRSPAAGVRGTHPTRAQAAGHGAQAHPQAGRGRLAAAELLLPSQDGFFAAPGRVVPRRAPPLAGGHPLGARDPRRGSLPLRGRAPGARGPLRPACQLRRPDLGLHHLHDLVPRLHRDQRRRHGHGP